MPLAARPGADGRVRRDRISSGHPVSIERPPLGLDRASTWQAARTHVHSAGFNAADKARAHSLPCNESMTDSAPFFRYLIIESNDFGPTLVVAEVEAGQRPVEK